MNTRKHLFETAFPFHLLLDHDLKITSIGKSLDKLGFHFDGTTRLGDYFKIKRPPVEMEFRALAEQKSTVFFLEALHKPIVLKGQLLEVGYHQQTELIFLGSPVFRRMEDVEDMGLQLNDFALHDTTLDYLVLMQVQDSIHNDTQRLADKLLEETKARRKAQEFLEKTNLNLESMVQARTEELFEANTKLKRYVDRLHSSNNDLRTLNSTGEILHGCQTVESAFPVVIKAVQDLFPDSFGRIACYNEDLGCFTVSAAWGDGDHLLGETFTHEECPAIVNETVFSGHGPRKGCGCLELEHMPDEFYYCRSLKVGDSILGLLHFHYGMDALEQDQEEWFSGKQTLAATLAEHMALALSNIRLRQKLEEESIRDPLTGLFNRRYMEGVLHAEMEKAKREKGQSFGLILLDIDHFKSFNDTHGHQAGDAVLVQVAALLSSQVRKGDVVCRYGGEEFLVVLANSSTRDTATRAESIRTKMEQLCISYEGSCLGPITISAGVTGFQKADPHMDSIIHRADNALYEAKEHGRNRVVVR